MKKPSTKTRKGKRVVLGEGYVVQNPGNLSTDQIYRSKRSNARMANLNLNLVSGERVRLIAEILE